MSYRCFLCVRFINQEGPWEQEKGILRKWLPVFDMSGIILCCDFWIAVHTALYWCVGTSLSSSFVMTGKEDKEEMFWYRIETWNYSPSIWTSISVSSFFSCYLFNFCHWCKKKKKRKKFEKMPGVGFIQVKDHRSTG